MSIPFLFRQYIWLVNTIRRTNGITFAELQDKWSHSNLGDGEPLSRSTFNRHKDAIEDIFGIIVDCNKRNDYRYYIRNKEVLSEDTVQNWMLSTISVNNILTESLTLQNRILLEQIPCEKHLQTILDAMKKGVRIAVKYQKYGSQNISVADFEPYCIKLFKQRWYVLGHFAKATQDTERTPDYFAVYSFDRIKEVELTNVSFMVSDNFDAKTFFDECYGVTVGDGTQAVTTVIRAWGKQQYYMRDVPWHHTQHVVAQGNDFVDYEMTVRPTSDFIGQILSAGKNVKVLSPIKLQDKVRLLIKEMGALYD